MPLRSQARPESARYGRGSTIEIDLQVQIMLQLWQDLCCWTLDFGGAKIL